MFFCLFFLPYLRPFIINDCVTKIGVLSCCRFIVFKKIEIILQHKMSNLSKFLKCSFGLKIYAAVQLQLFGTWRRTIS